MFCYYCMNYMDDAAEVCPSCGRPIYNGQALHHLKPGTTLLNGRYMVGRVLGEGGFGITYIGRDLDLDIRVAIKEYYPKGYANRNVSAVDSVTLTTNGENDVYTKGRERFLREARTLARFTREPSIVNVHDYFEANNTAYFVMDYLKGIDLKDYIKINGPLDPQTAIDLFIPLMEVLAKVHEQGMIHRDISPDNIIVEDGELILIDFGASREVYSGKSISVIHKPGYAPCEQQYSRGNQGPWTDVYALCATIYKCITNIKPPESSERIFEDRLVAPSKLGINIPPTIEAALMKGLSNRYEERQQDMYQLIQEFKGMPVDNRSKSNAKPFVDNIFSSQTEADDDDDDDGKTIYSPSALKNPPVKKAASPKNEDDDEEEGSFTIVDRSPPKVQPAYAAPPKAETGYNTNSSNSAFTQYTQNDTATQNSVGYYGNVNPAMPYQAVPQYQPAPQYPPAPQYQPAPQYPPAASYPPAPQYPQNGQGYQTGYGNQYNYTQQPPQQMNTAPHYSHSAPIAQYAEYVNREYRNKYAERVKAQSPNVTSGQKVQKASPVKDDTSETTQYTVQEERKAPKPVSAPAPDKNAQKVKASPEVKAVAKAKADLDREDRQNTSAKAPSGQNSQKAASPARNASTERNRNVAREDRKKAPPYRPDAQERKNPPPNSPSDQNVKKTAPPVKDNSSKRSTNGVNEDRKWVTVSYADSPDKIPKGAVNIERLSDGRYRYKIFPEGVSSNSSQSVKKEKENNQFDTITDKVKVLWNDLEARFSKKMLYSIIAAVLALIIMVVIVVSSAGGSSSSKMLASYSAPAELGSNLWSFNYEVGGDLYTLPTPVSEFIDNGWKIVENSGFVDGGGTSGITIQKGSEKMYAEIMNYDKSRMNPENCAVYRLNVGLDDSIYKSFALPGNIKIGTSKEELEKVVPNDFTKADEDTQYTYFKSELKVGKSINVCIMINEGNEYNDKVDYIRIENKKLN